MGDNTLNVKGGHNIQYLRMCDVFNQTKALTTSITSISISSNSHMIEESIRAMKKWTPVNVNERCSVGAKKRGRAE